MIDQKIFLTIFLIYIPLSSEYAKISCITYFHGYEQRQRCIRFGRLGRKNVYNRNSEKFDK